MRKRLTLIVSAISLIILCYSCKSSYRKQETQKSNNENFVKVDGAKFTVNKNPYYFVGTNFWFGAYLGADTDYGNRERLLRELDRLKENGITNLRIVAASEESDFSLPLDPPFQYKDGSYNEELLHGLDFLLAEMGKRNLRAVMVLNNYWDWSGGMSEYVSWATGEDVVDPTAMENGDWGKFLDFSARFYQLEEAQKRYRKYIAMLIERKNTYSGKLYKNDPAIMTWELANEPRPSLEGDPEESIKIFSNWIHETASYIHSLDKNHLVTTGSEGSKGTINSLDYALQAHKSEFIDYMTFHLWPKNWGWYKPEEPSTLASTKENTTRYINEHIELARKLNKPATLEEFGFMRDDEKYAPDDSVEARNEYYQFVFQIVENAVQEDSPLAGSNFWGYGGEGRARHEDHKWRLGDNMYLGDPYSEAQGLNSVYDTDESTLEIISKHSKRLEELSKNKSGNQ